MMRAGALLRTLFGADAKLQRMMQYWAASMLLYAVCGLLLVLQVAAGMSAPSSAITLILYSGAGSICFYALIRFSSRLKLAPRTLAELQGLFAVSCNVWLYALSGPLRLAAMLLLVVVIAFCSFAMRPRQTVLLSTIALIGMAVMMFWHVQADPLHAGGQAEALAFCYLAASLLTVTVLTGEMHKLRAHLKRQKEELVEAVATIRTLATVDELTSLANRRYMNDVLDREQRKGADGGVTCIALLDIDFFKRINDRHGHGGGDAVLRAFAGAARAELRAADVLARWGGEEFLLMLPSTGLPEAQQVLARMAHQVAGMPVPGIAGLDPVTFSAGVVAHRDGEAFTDTITRADKALYQAKAEGRNRIVAG